MSKNRIFYLLYVVVCILFSALYQSRISALLLSAAVIYPVVAALLSLISLYTLRAGFAEKQSVHEKNEAFEIPVFLHNNFIFPYAPVQLECLLPDCDTGLFMKKQVFACVAPLKKMRIFVPCMHKYRGSFAAKLMRITVYDPLRIIRFSRKADSVMQLVFLPRKISADGLGEVFSGESGSASIQNQSGDINEFSHAREYAMGDIFQMIHWKLTAKLDQLMVKQYDANNDCRTAVLCNFSYAAGSVGAVLRQSDMVAETAVAAAMSLMDSGVRAVVETGTAEAGSIEITDSGSFDRFYEMISVLPIKPQTEDFVSLIAKYISTEPAALIMITPVIGEGILAAAQAAGERLGGAAVLIYVNCTGKPSGMLTDEHCFVFAELCGDAQQTLPEAAEHILEDYLQLNRR